VPHGDAETGKIEVIVEDDGDGIPAELHEQAFVPFYRAEESRNRDTGGVGLGLSIARTIARSHGGDIRFGRSDDGKFRVLLTLPVASAS